MSTSEHPEHPQLKKMFWEEMEPIQLENIFHEDDVPLLSITKNRISALVMIGVVLVVIMFCLGFFVIIPREVQVAFELKGGDSEEIIQFAEPVQIKERHVSMGQTIRVKERLVSIYSDGIGRKIADYHNAANNIADFDRFARPRFVQEQSARKNEIDLLTGIISKIQSQIKQLTRNQNKSISDLESLVKIAESQYERDLKLYQGGAVALAALEQSNQHLVHAKSTLNASEAQYSFELTSISATLRDYEIQRQKLQDQVNTSNASFIEEQGKVEQFLDNAKTSITTIYGSVNVEENALSILAADNGVITLLNDSETTLASGTVICKLRTKANDFFASAAANPRQAGSLKKGQQVILKFSSFPYYYYGTMRGKIETISQSADPQGNFPLTISLDEEESIISNQIAKGMMGNAAVVVEEYSVMHYLFRKLLQVVKW